MNFATGVIFTLRLEIIKLRSSGRCIIFFLELHCSTFFSALMNRLETSKTGSSSKAHLSFGCWLEIHRRLSCRDGGGLGSGLNAQPQTWRVSLRLQGSASGFKGQPQDWRVSLRLEGSASSFKTHARAQAWRFRVGLRLKGSGCVDYYETKYAATLRRFIVSLEELGCSDQCQVALWTFYSPLRWISWINFLTSFHPISFPTNCSDLSFPHWLPHNWSPCNHEASTTDHSTKCCLFNTPRLKARWWAE